MLCSLSAHRLGAIADTASKQTAPWVAASVPQGERANHAARSSWVGWDGMGLCDAVAVVILLSPTKRSLPVTRTRADVPQDQTTRCVCVCVGLHTRFSLTSLAPRPKSLRPSVNSLSPLSIASGPHAQTHTHWTPTCFNDTMHTHGSGWQCHQCTIFYAYMYDLCDMYAWYRVLCCTYRFLTAQ